MNRVLFITIIFALSLTVNGQSKFENKVRELKRNIELVKEQEKETLKGEIELIYQKIENKEITSGQAEILKKNASEKSAAIIEAKIESMELQLRELIKSDINEEDNRIKSLDDQENEEDRDGGREKRDKTRNRDYDNLGNWSFNWNFGKRHKKRGEPLTTTQFVFAFGLNNIVTNGDLGTIEGNGIKLSNSRFYEWGWTWKTRLAPNSPFLNLKYGLSLTYNNLRPDNNQYYIKSGNKTLLAEHPYSLRDEPYFRMTNLVIPVHLEFDFSKKRKLDDDKIIIRTQNSIRAGIGGYAGINTRTKQILKYKTDGLRTDQTTKGDYNTSDFIYGLSAYVGYKDISLYTKWDLNPIFTDNTVEQKNVSFGLRFDFH
ncbi:MAG: hypothetical protein IPL55_01815 [Saprospiraceae bacterium]|nr:hypothetical protein [Saprospiraceae bacterium]MBL0024903.1 hypothetical protein [Saprospiraceae bacterium]